MSTLLQQTNLPLWVWINIIVVSSIVVLGTIAFTLRFWFVRRRQAAFIDTFGDENLPQRRVTVRRGRVVESSNYLSLTGSRFGLNAFGPEDGDTNSRAGARSKSPFEWWSTLKDRSHSRNSQITHMTMTNEAPSIYGMPSSPNTLRFYQRRDLSYSNSSLASTNKDDGFIVSVIEEPASPPALVRNFSRSFSRQGSHTGFSPRQPTLSRIEEASPHTSMISERRSRGASYASNLRGMKIRTPSPVLESPSASAQYPLLPQYEQQGQTRSKASSIYQETLHEAPDETLQVPAPAAYNVSRTSLYDQEPRNSYASSLYSLDQPGRSSFRQSEITALPEQPAHKQTTDYWDTRPDLKPVHSDSKTRKVLRKKSLRRAAMAAQAGS